MPRPFQKTIARRLLGLAAALPAAAAAQADAELLLREIPSVFAASGFEQSASDAPSAVSVITAEDIADHGWRTLAEALGSLRGFWVASDRAYSYVGVRGMLRPGDWNSRLLLRVDGHRVNAAVYDDVSFGADAVVDMGAIERIEVVRGPGSSLYGASAVYAVVDVVTKRGRDWRGVDAEVGAGSRGLRRAALRGGDRADGLEWSFSASATRSDGDAALFYPELAGTTPGAGYARDSDAERASLLMFGARWRDWTLQTALSQWHKQIPTGAYGTVLSDPRNRYDQQRAYLHLGRELAFGVDTSLRLAWSIDRIRYDGDYVYEGGTVNDDLSDGLWQRGEATLDHRVDADTRLVAGVEIQRERRLRQRNADPGRLYLDIDAPGHAEGLFAQVERALSPTLKLNVGLRADHYSSFGVATSPRLGAIWQPVEAHALKLLAGGAYRPPNAYELDYDDGGYSQRANASLKPERLRSLEAVWEGRLSPTLQASVSVWRNRLHGLIDSGSDADGLIRFRNASGVVAHGVEAQVDARLAPRLDARLTATWQRSRIDDGGEPLTNSPRRLGKLSLLWKAPADLTLAADLRALSATRSRAGDALGGAALLDLNATLPLGPRWRAVLALRNALDRDWHVPAGPEHDPVQAIPQPGRSAELRVGASF